MKSVGIRELKRGISGYLKEVRAGERILITDRRKHLAVITGVAEDQEKETVRRLVEAGIAYWTEGKPGKTVSRVRAKQSISDAVLEDRR